jgi:hypothetical protein
MKKRRSQKPREAERLAMSLEPNDAYNVVVKTEDRVVVYDVDNLGVRMHSRDRDYPRFRLQHADVYLHSMEKHMRRSGFTQSQVDLTLLSVEGRSQLTQQFEDGRILQTKATQDEVDRYISQMRE